MKTRLYRTTYRGGGVSVGPAFDWKDAWDAARARFGADVLGVAAVGEPERGILQTAGDELNPLERRCPVCDAIIGEPCKNTMAPGALHYGRVRALLEP